MVVPHDTPITFRFRRVLIQTVHHMLPTGNLIKHCCDFRIHIDQSIQKSTKFFAIHTVCTIIGHDKVQGIRQFRIIGSPVFFQSVKNSVALSLHRLSRPRHDFPAFQHIIQHPQKIFTAVLLLCVPYRALVNFPLPHELVRMNKCTVQQFMEIHALFDRLRVRIHSPVKHGFRIQLIRLRCNHFFIQTTTADNQQFRHTCDQPVPDPPALSDPFLILLIQGTQILADDLVNHLIISAVIANQKTEPFPEQIPDNDSGPFLRICGISADRPAVSDPLRKRTSQQIRGEQTVTPFHYPQQFCIRQSSVLFFEFSCNRRKYIQNRSIDLPPHIRILRKVLPFFFPQSVQISFHQFVLCPDTQLFLLRAGSLKEDGQHHGRLQKFFHFLFFRHQQAMPGQTLLYVLFRQSRQPKTYKRKNGFIASSRNQNAYSRQTGKLKNLLQQNLRRTRCLIQTVQEEQQNRDLFSRSVGVGQRFTHQLQQHMPRIFVTVRIRTETQIFQYTVADIVWISIFPSVK